MNADKVQATLEALKALGEFPITSTKQVYAAARANGFSYGSAKDTFLKPHLAANKRGTWNLSKLIKSGPSTVETTPSVQPVEDVSRPAPQVMKLALSSVRSVQSDEVFIPEQDPAFVQWGSYGTVKKIVDSRMFFPVYIAGMSGNGKTMMVEQACAKAKREYVRVQISPETDEDDLIGGFRLINGETVFQKGPVIKAMEAGAVLLIDELDRGSNKIMCLQGVLEGKPILIKKTGQTIVPAPGFNIFATANTKGRGSEDGRYVAAQVIDDAFIERFVASIDQPYPQNTVEFKIVKAHMDKYDLTDEEFVHKLVGWSTVIRKTYEADGVDEVISTRRLCHIVKAYSIFGNRLEAIEMCISRFETETRDAFLDLYTKIDSGELTGSSADGKPVPSNSEQDCPF